MIHFVIENAVLQRFSLSEINVAIQGATDLLKKETQQACYRNAAMYLIAYIYVLFPTAV